MLWANIGILILVAVLAGIYFLPYRRLKGKIFKKLLPDIKGITAMEYKTSAYSLQLEKRKGIWYVIDSDWEADRTKVTKLLNRLSDLNVDERISGAIDAPEFSIGSNGYLILDYGGKRITIAIGNRVENDEDYIYITKSGDPDILVVHSGALSLLPKDAGAFSDTLLFQAYYPQIKSLEANLGMDYISLFRTESGWMLDGNNIVKEEKAQSLIEEFEDKFHKAINDDLNMPIAMSVVWDVIRYNKKSKDLAKLLLKFDEVLGLKIDEKVQNSLEIPEEVTKLIEERKVARENKDWKLSDELRDRIKEKGYIIKDSKEGMQIEKA